MRCRLSRWLRSWVLFVAVSATAMAHAAEAGGFSGELTGELDLLKWKGAPRLMWKLHIGANGGIELRLDGAATQVRAELGPAQEGTTTWTVTQGRLALAEWSQGKLTSGAGELSGSGTRRNGHFTGALALTVHEVNLGELVRLGDPKQERIRSAEGRVEGTIRLLLNEDGTVNLGDSELHLAPGSVATIVFKAAPGLLTNYIPPAVRDAYPGLTAIEQGETPLEAKVLRLTYFAHGDVDGKTARIRIEGRPKDPRLVAPLELDVNVSGPVEKLLRQMSDTRLHFGGAR